MVWNKIINGKSQTVPLRFFFEGRGGLYTGYKLIRSHSHQLLRTDLAVNMPFSARSLNGFFFGRLNPSFPSSNSSTSTNATRDSRYSVNANLNLNQFRQAMLDGV